VSLPHILGEFWPLPIPAGQTTRMIGEFYGLLSVRQQCDLFMACYPLLQIIALSTTEAELMALASCCCEIVWAGKLALD